ncbi:MAG: ZIP family metal transporter [Succinivibrio sp.]|jgi:ZIP family zinc transporter|nr:ZIP family metal transporter [Succinivibrio sp.]
MDALACALLSSGFTFACTALGAAFVFLVAGAGHKLVTQLSLGFAAGIMIAASVFGLLIPAQQEAAAAGSGLLPVSGGFALGVLFLLLLDHLLPHFHLMGQSPEGPKTGWSRQTLLFTAITIHNVPEGMALGVLAAAAGSGSQSLGALMALAAGIGIQNIPEGTAVSVPYYAQGRSRFASFMAGTLSGLAEPLGAVLVVLCSEAVVGALPWFLAFAAGAMLYVVVEELIPQSHDLGNDGIDLATVSVLSGFLIMMALEETLG